MSDFRIEISDGKAAVYTPYNAEFVKRVKLIGGRWDGAKKCWKVSEANIPDVRDAMRAIYGRDDQPVSETVDVELVFEAEVYECRGPVTILGRTIAAAQGRDTGARPGDGVAFSAGAPLSGGSMRNWTTRVPAGCVVKLRELPKAVLDGAELPEGVIMKVAGGSIDRDALQAERERLLARLAEIDALLA